MKATTHTMTADVLVIGSGIAGLLLAIDLANSGASVIIASKDQLSTSNTAHAQGGIAAVTPSSTPDSREAHLKDTILSGCGLTDESVARMIITEGANLIRHLRDLEIKFDVGLKGHLELAREGGHSHARVVHSKDSTGKAISDGLINKVRTNSNILALQNTCALDLIVIDGQCVGANVLFGGEQRSILAGHVVLSSGGLGALFERTTNPLVATGDGIAMAYRAGAQLIDMEFVQFHPTALFKPGAAAFLISEAVRGAGALLVDKNGQQFARRFHPDGELATRDIVARGINTVMLEQQTPCVWLDMRPIGATSIKSKFPYILERCLSYGINPLTEPIPVAPAAHYFMGGIKTNENGQSTLPGLYAIGECASTGLHGANRLASNSLLEAGVMALRASQQIIKNQSTPLPLPLTPKAKLGPLIVPSNLASLAKLMYQEAGIIRTQTGLKKVLSQIAISSISALPTSTSIVQSANIMLLSKLICKAALERSESRGSHFRLDYPNSDDASFLRRFYLSLSGNEWTNLTTQTFVVHSSNASPV